MDQSNEQKKAAALEAAKEIHDGMILGLGMGSTVYYLLPEVGRMIREGASFKGHGHLRGNQSAG